MKEEPTISSTEFGEITFEGIKTALEGSNAFERVSGLTLDKGNPEAGERYRFVLRVTEDLSIDKRGIEERKKKLQEIAQLLGFDPENQDEVDFAVQCVQKEAAYLSEEGEEPRGISFRQLARIVGRDPDDPKIANAIQKAEESSRVDREKAVAIFHSLADESESSLDATEKWRRRVDEKVGEISADTLLPLGLTVGKMEMFGRGEKGMLLWAILPKGVKADVEKPPVKQWALAEFDDPNDGKPVN